MLPLPWLLGGLVAVDVRLPAVATTAIAAVLGLVLRLASGVAMAQPSRR